MPSKTRLIPVRINSPTEAMKARAACAAVLIVIAARAGGHPLAPRPEHKVTAQELVYRVPGMDRVRIRKDIP